MQTNWNGIPTNLFKIREKASEIFLDALDCTTHLEK